MACHRLAALAALTVAASVLAACGSDEAGPTRIGTTGSNGLAGSTVEDSTVNGSAVGDDARDPDAADGPGLVVVATLAPVADLVAAVLGDRGTVHTLIPQGADAHTHEPRPSDVQRISEADAYIGVGLDLNASAVRLARENLPAGAPLVLLAEVALGPDDLITDSFGSHSHGHSHAHDDDHGHVHAHSHADHGHSHSHGSAAPNPHVWVDPGNAMAMVEAIGAALADLDPDGADHYRTNAADLIARIRALDDVIAEAAATIPAEARKLVVYHDAWAYFGPRYGLEVIAALQPADLAEPSARDVAGIIDQIRAEGVPKVFGSVEFPSDVLSVIAEETGAAYGTELSDDLLPGRPGDPEHSYLGLLAANARAIVEGLGGDPAAIDRGLDAAGATASDGT